VGVVGDARDAGINEAPVPTVYQCTTAAIGLNFLVRTHSDPLALAAAIRTKLKEIEPLRSVYDIAPLDERISAAFGENRLRTVLLALFAAAALTLACIGVYGTLSYVVSLGRREVGLRLALGARQSGIVAHYLFTALKTVGLACVAGAALALATTRGLAGMLYGVSPSDPLTLFIVVLVVVGVAALAAILPALRASRIDPMQALREE
jgi:ABC-type antimicrobial peptide transport system permease subunit